MRRCALVLAVVVALLGLPAAAAATPPAATPNDTFTIFGSAVTTPVIIGTCPDILPPGPPQPVPIVIEVEGTAVISRLGRAAVVVDETGLGICVGDPSPAPIAVLTALGTYTAANGDELHTRMVSSTPLVPVPGTPAFQFTSYDEILPSSTGRFAGATGFEDVVVTFDPTLDPPARFTLTGEITLPKS